MGIYVRVDVYIIYYSIARTRWQVAMAPAPRRTREGCDRRASDHGRRHRGRSRPRRDTRPREGRRGKDETSAEEGRSGRASLTPRADVERVPASEAEAPSSSDDGSA